MPASPIISWTDLFASQSPADFTLELRAIKKSGRPFLFVPSSSPLAAQSLSLYPAQTGRAKLAKSILRAAFRMGLPLGFEKTSFAFSSKEPFPHFLSGLVRSEVFPPLSILAGNPRTAGCRFIILLFDDRQQPAFVVKAGLGDSARQLIRHEAAFLHSVPPGTPGVPLLRGALDLGHLSAFALDFAPGDSPGPEATPALEKLLTSWLDQGKQVHLFETLTWRALAKTCSADPVFSQLSQKLLDCNFHPAIVHGDFAPWNIKVSPDAKTWHVLDWERGDLIGIPGWDWFHYLIQSGILVSKAAPEQLFQKIEELFASVAFQNYVGIAGIKGCERPLLMAYLLHLIQVIRPSEGIETNKPLLSLLAQRWVG